MNTVRTIIIMAGGAGERFWPLSRQNRPKQLLNLTSPDRSLLAEAVARVTPLVSAEHVYIVTGKHLQAAVREAGLGIPPENVVAEPYKRNTAGCLAYAAAVLLAKYDLPPEQITAGVITADHEIGEPEKFRRCIETALNAAENADSLVTIGVRPTRPETGYGYIETAANTAPAGGSTAEHPVFPVVRFREKPDYSAAVQFLEAGRFLWNSGMFFWRLSTYLQELETARPDFCRAVGEMVDARRAGDGDREAAVFGALESISIDYALLEKARRVLVVPATFPWDDVGAWDALSRSYPRDDAGNVAVGDPVLSDSSGCIVYNAVGAGKAVAVVGGHDLIVVVTEDAVLVVPRDRAQDVKDVVNELKKRGAPQL